MRRQSRILGIYRLAANRGLTAGLAALSSNCVHIHADRAGHYVHHDDPELVVQAIRELVRRCR